ncbi:MAG: endonuclease/exonuclease/phosphatase family protein, partial [Candidatus Electrothrix sp. AUS4]|nr:endonuclease/exonuclease/phosphatase family protein [Candidatus Electrothrix sp. AUS4]
NVNNRDLTDAVCALAVSTAADVLILNENTVPSSATLHALQRSVSADFYRPTFISEKRFHCFCRNSKLDLSEVHSGFRTSVRKYRLGSQRVLLALVHGVDLRNYDAETRQSFVQELIRELDFVREDKEIHRLILLGDFNMNPYDRPMNLAAGLNAMMTRACAAKGVRQHLEKDYDFYYNPMWSLLGDNTKGPAGTVYDTSNQGPYGWSMFDQVILHHSVIPFFEDVEIVTEVGEYSFMDKNGHPDVKKASDHFPIIATFMEK